MARSSQVALLVSAVFLVAALVPLTAGQAEADVVSLYLDANGAGGGKMILATPTATTATAVAKPAAATSLQSTAHTWLGENLPGDLTATAAPTVIVYVETTAPIGLGSGNPTTQPPGKFWLKVQASLAGNTSAIAWAEFAGGAGAKEVAVPLTFASGFPMTAKPSQTLSVTTTVYATQPSGTQSTYFVNATTAMSRLDIPGTLEGYDGGSGGDGDDGGDGNDTTNGTGGDDDNATGNETGNGTGGNGTGDDNGTEPNPTVKSGSDGKKKDEGFLPGFEVALFALAASLALALVRGRRGGQRFA